MKHHFTSKNTLTQPMFPPSNLPPPLARLQPFQLLDGMLSGSPLYANPAKALFVGS